MRIYRTEHALFSEFYERQVGLRQVVTIRKSLLEQVNAAQHLSPDDETSTVGIAVNLYVRFYEKTNPQNRIESLLNEIGSYTTKKFQKASEYLGRVDPSWDVPVFAVTWLKKKSDINQVLGNPICSKCKKELRNIGNYFNDVKAGGGKIYASYTDGTMSSGVFPDVESGWDQWLGTVCPNCDFIFCSDCLDSTGKGLCPKCNISVIPALAKDLPSNQKFIGGTDSKEIHNLKTGDDDKVVFVREFKKQIEFAPAGKMNIYMMYRADSAQIAQDFLAKHPVNENNIIVVETPEGNFGRNKEGIYKE